MDGQRIAGGGDGQGVRAIVANRSVVNRSAVEVVEHCADDGVCWRLAVGQLDGAAQRRAGTQLHVDGSAVALVRVDSRNAGAALAGRRRHVVRPGRDRRVELAAFVGAHAEDRAVPRARNYRDQRASGRFTEARHSARESHLPARRNGHWASVVVARRHRRRSARAASEGDASRGQAVRSSRPQQLVVHRVSSWSGALVKTGGEDRAGRSSPSIELLRFAASAVPDSSNHGDELHVRERSDGRAVEFQYCVA